MNRFSGRFQKRRISGIWVTLALFLLVFFLFSGGLNLLSQKTSEEQLASLEKSLYQTAVHCYCVEGSYPESLDYLKENYGLSFDENRFFVDYQPLGENIMPDITVLARNPR